MERMLAPDFFEFGRSGQSTRHDGTEIGNRSSIWLRFPEGWRLRFH
jgi:hypothetical protein